MKLLSKLFTALGRTPDFRSMDDQERRAVATALLKNGRIDQFNDGIRRACGANLVRSVLFRIDLTSLDFSGLNLSGADLSRAILDGTDFKGTNLSHASLIGVTISGDVKDADLSYAELEFADLTGAKHLCEAQVKSAQINGKTKLPPYLVPTCDKSTTPEGRPRP